MRFVFVLLVMLAGAAGYVYLERELAVYPDKMPGGGRLNQQVAQVYAGLNVPRRDFELVTEKAVRTADAVLKGEYAEAQRLMEAVQAQSRMTPAGFAPFNRYLQYTARRNNKAYEQALLSWQASEPQNGYAALLLARYALDTGWLVRGDGHSSTVLPEHMARFEQLMGQALAASTVASVNLPENPLGVFIQVRALGSLGGDSPVLQAAFETGLRKFPDYLPLYRERLTRLAPQWGGSLEAMQAFVDGAVEAVGASPSLRLLYLDLYAQVTDMLERSCKGNAGCLATALEQPEIKQLQRKNRLAVELFKTPDLQLVMQAAAPPLRRMVMNHNSAPAYMPLLQEIAEATGSSTELTPAKTAKPNYLVDQLTGLMWYRQGHLDNAMTKYRAAVAAALQAGFEREEDRLWQLADLYDSVASVYNRQNSYVGVIAAQQATEQAGGVTAQEGRHTACHSYYKLGAYSEAIAACAVLLNLGADAQTYYWSAASKEKAGKVDDALADYAVAADSEDLTFRTAAANQIGFIYGQRNDMKNMLATLNRYTYLYDPQISPANSVAVAYNNRCYAKKQLGELASALEDCNASLRYGQIPDAISKKSELEKLLQAQKNKGL